MDPSIANVARLFLILGAAVASVCAQSVCSNPSVRREWRTLSTHERAGWIDAVNVRPRPSSTIVIEIRITPLVPVETTSRSQTDRNAAGKRVAYSTHQPGFFVLRWYVYAGS